MRRIRRLFFLALLATVFAVALSLAYSLSVGGAS